MGDRGLDSTGSGHRKVTGFCEQRNELWDPFQVLFLTNGGTVRFLGNTLLHAV